MAGNTDNFKRGSIELILLHLLQGGDLHAYRLVQMILKNTGGRFAVLEGSLYPLLYRMETDGYISAREESVRSKAGRSRIRILYHIEPAGIERYRQLVEQYQNLRAAVDEVLRRGIDEIEG